MVLADGTELEIQDGASMHGIEMQVADYAALESLAAKFTEENLSAVKFKSGDQITGEYSSMILNEPHFLITQKTGYLSVIIGLREMTREERQQKDVQTAISYLTDEQAVSVMDLHPEWEPNKAYKMGERKKYKGELYKCLLNYTP